MLENVPSVLIIYLLVALGEVITFSNLWWHVNVEYGVLTCLLVCLGRKQLQLNSSQLWLVKLFFFMDISWYKLDEINYV